MRHGAVSSIAIVGGDLSAWAAAAWLANSLKGLEIAITVLELPDMVNAEPMQYTAPETLRFFEPLGIDITRLINITGATYRLGTGLHRLRSEREHRILPFGNSGTDIGHVHFHHFITRALLRDEKLTLNDHSPTAMAARAGKFHGRANDPSLPTLSYGLNFNAAKLTKLLRDNATINGVGIVQSRIGSARLNTDDGQIESLLLEDETSLAADLFIDCSGEAALLIGKALDVEFIDWSQFLPASRSIAVTAKTDHHNIPVHHCTATDDGWFLSTPLQHRTACQFRYSPEHVSDELAATHIERFVRDLGPEALVLSNMPSGHRQYMWHKNCVALGGAAGWVEPLDISNFDFLMSGLSRLTSLMPTLAMQDSLATLFNREMIEQLACVRDFGLLHYYAAQWRDTPFWNATREHEKPDSLRQRIELFASSSRVRLEEHETFRRDTWAAAFLAAGITPRAYDPLLDLVNDEQIQQYFSNMRRAIQEAVRKMPNHREHLAQLRH